MPSPTTRRYAGVPPDERRRARRERLVAATADLVGEVGISGLTVAGVCDRAGLSKRYFYESFPSVDDLVAAALQDVFDRVAAVIEASDVREDAPPADLVGVAVNAALDALDDPRLARLYLEAGGVPAAEAARDRATQSFVDQMLERLVGDAKDLPQAQMLGHLLVSGTTHVVTIWLRGDLDLDRADLVRHLTEIGLLAAERLTPGDDPQAGRRA